MTRYYPDLGSASDWSGRANRQYEISALVNQTSFRGENSCSVARSRLFSQEKYFPNNNFETKEYAKSNLKDATSLFLYLEIFAYTFQISHFL